MKKQGATGQFFPIGTGLYNLVGLRAHWDRVPVPGSSGQKVSESEFYTHTPGGLWSDNSVAILAALFRIQFPRTAEGNIAPPPLRLAPRTPDTEQLKLDEPR
jgi:hypothetical protein